VSGGQKIDEPLLVAIDIASVFFRQDRRSNGHFPDDSGGL
jgi:hypothetical protein